MNGLTNAVKNVQDQGFFPVILCSEAARPLVKASSRRDLPDLAVISVPELVSDVRIESLGEISMTKLEGA
jgi:flagellar biosynthesis protein FlhA